MKFIPGPDDCENVEGYEEGGFHPVMIGDRFSEGRYAVVHKLGSGGYSTVWLVRDHHENRYAALKILTADSSSYSEELTMYQHRQKNGTEEYDKCQVVPLLDSFWSESINGRHLCLVFEVMGPSVASFQRGEMKKIRPDVVRKVALQTAQGLMELHKRGVAYGDLSAANLLFRLSDISAWSTEELYDKLGHPEPDEMLEAVFDEDKRCWNNKPCEVPHAPMSLYLPIDLSEMPIELLRPEVRFIDLGEAYLVDSPGEGYGVNFNYADPETLWWSEKPNQASDVWALACVWYEMRAAEQLFFGFFGDEDVKNDIDINTIGALPAPWIEKLQKEWAEQQAAQSEDEADLEMGESRVDDKVPFLKKSAQDTSEELNTAHAATEDEEVGRSLTARIKKIGQWKPWCYLSIQEREEIIRTWYGDNPPDEQFRRVEPDTGNPPPGPLSDDEAVEFKDVLRLMLTYKRSDRVQVEQVLAHPWLQRDFEQSTEQPWLEQFHPGFLWRHLIM